MAERDPTVSIPELRNLLQSLLANQKPASVVFDEAQPVKMVRPAVARDIAPFRPVTVDSTTVPKLILPANPTRVAAIVRNLSAVAGDSIVVAGVDGNAPALNGADAIGLEIKPGESLTLEMTGAIYAIKKVGDAKAGGVEMIAQVSQDSK